MAKQPEFTYVNITLKQALAQGIKNPVVGVHYGRLKFRVQ